MASKKVASKSSTTSDSYTGLVTQSHLKRNMIIIRENPLFNNSTPSSNLLNKESHLQVVSIMMAYVTVEAIMVEMERKINFLMKVVEEQDHEIAALKDQMKACETVELSKTPAVKANDKGKVVLQENQTQQSVCRLPISPTAIGYDRKFH
ncbi:ty3-gypsy retrotransposon protein [Cucumis melo var. makuwa]|uniref:Ty3-gypsy retrotransposon protein n=1 Tax=Cucumis melo var. makuwa TaxID=1194695 RepID=A0A5A7VKD9_CUCMM|nr:ty3-gypsy retrotransposon protein [Cucumis melo var. makuwa]TYJ97137.1 ty3-gypsy retrotransposon protein [Cucumis melo var. makuwa]